MVPTAIAASLHQLLLVMEQLNPEQYAAACPALSHASMGQHCRHIIECFDCLLDQYNEGHICYDKRKRDSRIETDLSFAQARIRRIMEQLDRPDQDLRLTAQNDAVFIMKTSYWRELYYNHEHCIHHQALIRVALQEIPNIIVPENFGVAQSTIQYRHQCAQ